jgi:hypothetical protein
MRKGNAVMESVLHGAFGRVSLHTHTITIGRATNNHIVINDASVSVCHACIQHETTGYSITDLGTPGGTRLNGVRLKGYVPYVLHHFDTVDIGNATCVYEIVTLTPSFVSVGLRYLPLFPTIQYPAPWQPVFRSGAGFKIWPLPLRFSWSFVVVALLGIVLVFGLLTQLALDAAGWLQNFEAARTLYTYCTAFKNQDYATAYALLDSDSQHTLRLADFIHIIQRSTEMSTIVACHVGTVRTMGALVWGEINYSQSNGGAFTIDYLLRKQDHRWRISHLVESSSDLLLTTYCYALAIQAYPLAYTVWSTPVRHEMTISAFSRKLHSAAITGCDTTAVGINGTRAFAMIAYTTKYASPRLYFVDLIYDEGCWWIDNQRPPV